MNFLGNPEIKKSAFIYFLLSAAANLAGFFLFPQYALFTLCITLIFAGVHFAFSYLRYKKLRDLTQEIDLILYNNSLLNIDKFSEGELSVLSSEIYKMTVKMREQASNLKKDKTYLSDSIADISHQIRTPLTSIGLIVRFLSSENSEQEVRAQKLKELSELLSRIDRLISSLLKMSKLDAGTAQLKAEVIDVGELIRSASEPLAIPMELRNQTLNSFTNGESIRGDFYWTTEALLNVIKNCMEHTPQGGIIDIQASENLIYTEITITDNGEGISKEDLPYLFERFYKGRNSAPQSVGIGLALARRIISEQNGTIKAQNSPEGGAKFLIRFYKSTVTP